MAKEESERTNQHRRDLKIRSWIVITGLAIAVATANVEVPLIDGWNLPLKESGLQYDQIYGAKAATLAVLSAMSLFVALIPHHPQNVGVIDRLAGVTSAGAGLFAGWFWLLGETLGNPVPFLIAIVPATFYVSIGMLCSFAARRAVDIDRQQRPPRRVNWRFQAQFIAAVATLIGYSYLLIWLPSQLF